MIVIRHEPRITYHYAHGDRSSLFMIRCAAGVIWARTPEELPDAIREKARVWYKRWPGVSAALCSVANHIRHQGVPGPRAPWQK